MCVTRERERERERERVRERERYRKREWTRLVKNVFKFAVRCSQLGFYKTAILVTEKNND